MIDLLLIFIVAFAMTQALIFFLRRYALTHLLQLPHTRGTHNVAVPTGIGLACVITMVSSLAVMLYLDYLPASFTIALLIGSSAIAAIGWWDDHRHASVSLRFVIQFSAIGIVLASVKGFPELHVLNYTLTLAWIGHLLALLGSVWLINLYNFMDGIDAYAGTQAIFVAINIALMSYLSHMPEISIFLLILIACMAAFLCWNWPPAKIFMGDVCSCFLGFIFAALMIYTAASHTIPLITWLILLSIFIVDASCTLFKRLLLGYSFHDAHCSHAYSHAVRHYGGHLGVVLRANIINYLWLAPMAWFAYLWPAYDVYIFIIAVAPIFYIILKLKAGSDHSFEDFLKS